MDAADWDARYAANGLLWTSRPNRSLVAEVAGLEPGRALDVACGEGRNAVWLASQGWTVTAIDHSAVGIDKGKELAAEAGVTVEWVLGDVTSFASPASFDLVVVLYLHLPRNEMERALQLAVTSLVPGGTLVLIGHHADNIEKGIGGPQVPEILYEPDDIVAMLGDLTIEKAEMVERPVERAGVSGIALDTLVRGRA